jgi:hypothetical protein
MLLTGLGVRGEGRGALRGALLTTYDPPDPGILIEEYLPAWLGLKNAYVDEGADRLRYFTELERALRGLKGHISIVSSVSSDGGIAATANAWIWNYIRRFEVGAEGAAVQHAKLWMFHRGPSKKGELETIELVVSSANLTRDGLRGQIQAGWRCVLPLDAQSSRARKDTWGILPEFLTELGRASGSNGSRAINHWRELLRHCECPAGVEFIASVPGKHSAATLRRSAWGAAGLRTCWSGRSAPRMIAMAPTIGRWDSRSIERWLKFARIEPERMSLAWLRQSHPWAGRWQLDADTEGALTRCGIRWLEVVRPYDDDWESPLCREHQETDPRWSHAKLYELREGARRRLLITSANVSRAAWGDPQANGGLVIDNFELGVLLGIQAGFGGWFSDRQFDRATSEIDFAPPAELPIAWLAAEWDGKKLTVECRTTSKALLAQHVEVTAARAKSSIRISVNWRSGALARTTLPWREVSGVPLLIRIRTTDRWVRETTVQDVRETAYEFLCGEFDEAELREEHDRLVEEKYEYLPIVGTDGRGSAGEGGATSVADGADYAVPAYVDARGRFRLIDNWWKELREADQRARGFIKNDGQRILERWTAFSKSGADRGIRLAAKIAADELKFRLARIP